jgi:EAL domain-containing protein (putative c-di-GMP-specific phosphodiesterase class I)
MVELARTVGAQVVAERIETEAEAALMRELGVEYGQGWLFGKPGPLPGR